MLEVKKVEQFHQMSIDEWMDIKQSLDREMQSVANSFVRIGYYLRKIEDMHGYENGGYKSLAEFARAEYGLNPTTVSRFKKINERFSEGGYSEVLQEQFRGFGQTKLADMLSLPDEAMGMLEPGTPRETIRELKAFEKENAAAAAEAEDPGDMPGQMDLTDLEEPEEQLSGLTEEDVPAAADRQQIDGSSAAAPAAEESARQEASPEPAVILVPWIAAFWAQNAAAAADVLGMMEKGTPIDQIRSEMIPSGNLTFRYRTTFIVFYTDSIRIRQFGSGLTQMTWEEFLGHTAEMEAAVNGDAQKGSESEDKAKAEKSTSDPVNAKLSDSEGLTENTESSGNGEDAVNPPEEPAGKQKQDESIHRPAEAKDLRDFYRLEIEPYTKGADPKICDWESMVAALKSRKVSSDTRWRFTEAGALICETGYFWNGLKTALENSGFSLTFAAAIAPAQNEDDVQDVESEVIDEEDDQEQQDRSMQAVIDISKMAQKISKALFHRDFEEVVRLADRIREAAEQAAKEVQ